ncbi:MAG: zf-HC2 domain-containing protein [Gemmatimonadales bacterium]
MKQEHGIDCHQAAQRLYDYLDGELSSDDEKAVRGHLRDCAPCFSLFNFEEAYVKFLSARAKARKAPEHLKLKIFEQVMLMGDEAEEE